MANGSPSADAAAARRQARIRRLRAWLQPQVSIGAREQRDQAVLLLAVAVIVAPHFEHLPFWSIAAIGMMWVWRAWLTQSLKPAPGRVTMFVLLIAGTAAVWYEHGTLFGRDASVNFLLVLIGLKVLEMRAHRDVLVIVFLSMFVLQTQFLFDQSILSAVIMFTSVGMLFFVLLSVNLPEGDISFPGKLRYLLRVFLLALPLALALFFLFPRLPSPVWNSGGGELESSTGLSGSMSPGTISQLLRNDAVALRARFVGPPPEQRYLYWRGPVFGAFDGRTWSPLALSRPATGAAVEVRPQPGSAVDYTVTLEPTRRHELIALEFADLIDGVPTSQSRLTPTMELQTAAPVVSRLRYQVRSYTNFTLGPTEEDGSLADWRKLPANFNPRTQEWAQGLRARIAGTHEAHPRPLERRLSDAVLEYFHREPFRYNINAALQLGHDSVDDFLFENRVGYCEHYASAYVVVMRAMGLPARVVTGYQGGEVNPVDGYLTVRQSDAHAWAEVWVRGQGWIRVDPTAAVAPERVEHTLRERPAEGMAGAIETVPWLKELRLNREALENAWNQWFLTYSAERQRALVSMIGLRPTLENIAALAIGVCATLLLLLTVHSLRRRVRRDPLAELVYRLRAKLERVGITLAPHTGLQDMGHQMQGQLDPQCLPALHALLEAISAARYGRPEPRTSAVRIRALQAQLRRWRPVRAPDNPSA